MPLLTRQVLWEVVPARPTGCSPCGGGYPTAPAPLPPPPPVGGSLTVQEVDGDPSGTVTTIQFANGTVTFPSTGVARVAWPLAGPGDGAPADAEYLVAAPHAGLSAERVLTAGAGIAVSFAAPGQATVTNADGGAAAVTTHTGLTDPHPQYLTATEGDAAYSPVTHNHDGVYQPADQALTDLAAATGTLLSDKILVIRQAAGSTHRVFARDLATDYAGMGFSPIAVSGAYTDLTGTPDLSVYAPLASPTLTGTPAAPTAAPGTNTTQVATTAFVQAAVTAGGGYTDEAAQDAVGGILVDSARIDLTYSDATPSIAADLVAGSVAAGYLSASATDVVFGRSSAGGGAGQEIPFTTQARQLADDTSFPAMLTTLGGTAVGQAVFTLANPSAVRFLRVNADNTVTALDAAGFRTAIGAGTGNGDALTAGHLGQFAVTTSAQLRGVLSDETGTGAAYFQGGDLGTPSAGTLTNCTFPTLNQNTTGNAGTATALQTARAVNGVSFNGTADITVTAAAGTLTGTTLNAAVVSSSLTSVGTLTGGATGAGFTLAFGTSTLTGQVPVANGGTGLSAVGAAGKVPTSVAGALAYRDPAGDLTTATDGPTVTFDLSVSRRQLVTLGGNRTLALSNDADGMAFTLVLKQDGTGNRVPTFWSGILWQGGSAPTLTTTANKYDVFAFLRISSGVYLGFSPAQNF